MEDPGSRQLFPLIPLLCFVHHHFTRCFCLDLHTLVTAYLFMSSSPFLLGCCRGGPKWLQSHSLTKASCGLFVACSQGHEPPNSAYLPKVLHICLWSRTHDVPCWQCTFFGLHITKAYGMPQGARADLELKLELGLGPLPPPNKACLLSQLHLASSPACWNPESVSQGLSLQQTPANPLGWKTWLVPAPNALQMLSSWMLCSHIGPRSWWW